MREHRSASAATTSGSSSAISIFGIKRLALSVFGMDTSDRQY
jgi:hypothetical protein